MSRRTPRSVSLALASMLAVAVYSVSGQNPNQDPAKPAGAAKSNSYVPPGKQPNPTGAGAVPIAGTGNGRTQPGRGPTGNPGRPSSGGSNTGAIVGGAAGAAAAGVALFEFLHHAHAQDSGQPVQRLNLTLHYPGDWQLNPRLNLEDDPISFNTFNGAYLRGGIIPPGGADIDIARFPHDNRAVPELIANELSDTEEKTIDSHSYRIDGQSGTRVVYTDVYAPGFVYRNVVVYLARADGLYKFFLTYHQGDPHEKSFNDDFDHILKSVHFRR